MRPVPGTSRRARRHSDEGVDSKLRDHNFWIEASTAGEVSPDEQGEVSMGGFACNRFAMYLPVPYYRTRSGSNGCYGTVLRYPYIRPDSCLDSSGGEACVETTMRADPGRRASRPVVPEAGHLRSWYRYWYLATHQETSQGVASYGTSSYRTGARIGRLDLSRIATVPYGTVL